MKLPTDQDASGRSLGDEEIELLCRAIRSGTLTSTKGTFVRTLEQRFAELLGVRHAYACSSGSAAIHTAVAALDPEPGDEIITSAITDMGALTPLLYQGAIPVFADVDPDSALLTPETVRARLSPRTRAVIVTHLFGHPCDMDGIAGLAAERGIAVIEDCAQAFLARWRERPVGSLGTIGCFSLQQGKHITAGEGGLITTDDPELARRIYLFVNKAWGYGDAQPDHYFLALNYRMTELQGAVAVAQLEKLPRLVERRAAAAARLVERLRHIDGVEPFPVPADTQPAYWRFCLRVDARAVPGGPAALGRFLAERNIASAPRYIQKPAFQCALFRERRTFGSSEYPFNLARPEALDYAPARFPGTFAALDRILVLPWNEAYESPHVDFIADSIAWAVERAREVRA